MSSVVGLGQGLGGEELLAQGLGFTMQSRHGGEEFLAQIETWS